MTWGLENSSSLSLLEAIIITPQQPQFSPLISLPWFCVQVKVNAYDIGSYCSHSGRESGT